MGSAVSGIGLIGFLTPALANPLHFATASNRWTEFLPFLPAWLFPRDPVAILDFYVGNSTLYTCAPPARVDGPAGVLGGFILVLFGTTLCLMAILRTQWIARERLSFPIVQVPLEMTVQRGGFANLLRSRAFQIGFLLPCLLQTLNSLSYLYPNIPAIPGEAERQWTAGPGPGTSTPRPWSALGYFPLGFHPNTIGLAYLLSVEVSFKLLVLLPAPEVRGGGSGRAGVGEGSGGGALGRMPYFQEQGAGAWLAIAAFSLWMARGAFASAWRQAFVRRRVPMPARPCQTAALLSVWGWE